MANIKVFYFDFRGRAEVTRLVLALAGQDFEDIRWSREDWPKHKPDSPFGQAPFVEFEGKKYGQSAAIAAFFANQYGFYGKSNLDRLRIDEVVGITQDLLQAMIKAMQEQDETKKAELETKLKEEEFPKFFGFYQKLLQENKDNGVFVGKDLTLADLYVYNIMFSLQKMGRYDAADAYPELKTLRDKVESNDNIQNYLKNRKETPF